MKLCIQENAFYTIVCEMVAILSRDELIDHDNEKCMI